MPTKVRLEKIEREIFVLRKKQKADEEKIANLEEKLDESHRRIKELESAAGNTQTLSTLSVDGPNSDLRQKIADLERKCNDIGKRCDQLSKLQTILNGLIVKRCNIFQRDTQLEEQTQGTQNNAQGGLSDPNSLEMSRDIIAEHRLPLNFMDYSKLSALECISGQTDGPASKIGELVLPNFQCHRNGMLRRLKAAGKTATQATAEYLDLCMSMGRANSLPLDTKIFFALVWDVSSWIDVLFGINREHLSLLDPNSKKEIKKWKTRDVTACTIDSSYPMERHIRVEFGADGVLKLKSNEMMEYFELMNKFC